MGLSELMRMIIIFVTFCLNKKKNLQESLIRPFIPHSQPKKSSSRNHLTYSWSDPVSRFIPYLLRNEHRHFVILKGT